MNPIVLEAIYQAFSEQWAKSYVKPSERLKALIWEWHAADPARRCSKRLLLRAAEILAGRIER